jgi:hypothetical protein
VQAENHLEDLPLASAELLNGSRGSHAASLDVNTFTVWQRIATKASE